MLYVKKITNGRLTLASGTLYRAISALLEHTNATLLMNKGINPKIIRLSEFSAVLVQ